MTDISRLYSASKTKRWHTYDGPNQNVGEHSFGVAMIIAALHPKPSSLLLQAAIWHDIHEKEFADIPHNTKKAHSELRNIEESSRVNYLFDVGLFDFVIEEEERFWLKYADQLEVYLYLSNATFVLSGELTEIKTRAYNLALEFSDILQKRFNYDENCFRL